MVKVLKDLTGQKFGMLLVLGHESLKGWKCLCDCGSIYYTNAYNLIHGRSSSCGCKQYEHNKFIVHPKRGHSVFHKDMEGRRFGRLTVIKSVGYIKSHECFLCKCDCGNETTVNYHKLISGHTKSCGSNLHKIKVDLSGKRFGRLVLIRPLSINGSNGAIWECKCDCGNVVNISGHNIMATGIKSCGCLKRERSDNKVFDTRLHSIWNNMKDRCKNHNNPNYKHYGGRGISICDEWKDFRTFKDWAESHGYTDELTIERIDVNGNYCPQNCRWATVKEQAQNKRNTLLYLYKGKVVTLSELAEITNQTYDNLHYHYQNNTLDKWLADRGY